MMLPYKPPIFAVAVAALAISSVAHAQDTFDWSAITPNSNLEYHDCYEALECARLEVPMDWVAADRGEKGNRTVVLAIAKLSAVVSPNDTSYGGTSILNPGGPGGSGVSFIKTHGEFFQEIVDTPKKRHFDMLSFDPRGVGFTTPAVNCFKNDPLGASTSILEGRQTWGVRSNVETTMAYAVAKSKAYGRRCGNQEVLAYVNTPSVARDMVEIIDKIDELEKSSGRHRTVKEGSKPRINYLGLSYGTILGNFFASLFPGRVGRMIVDGVADSYDYSSGPVSVNLPNQVVDRWLDYELGRYGCYNKAFLEGCFDNPSTCALYKPGDRSANDIQKRVDDYIKALDEVPQVAKVAPSSNVGPNVVVTGVDVGSLAGNALYNAVRYNIELSQVLNQSITENDPSVLANTVRATWYPTNDQSCSQSDTAVFPGLIYQQSSAIRCIDADDLSEKSIKYWVDYTNDRIKQSSLIGLKWASLQVDCSGWPAKSNWNYDGPFESSKPDKSGNDPNLPAAPILFLSTKLDPVTPLASARKMAKGHTDSRVIVLDTTGHSAILSAPSQARDDIIRKYFDTGNVPEKHESIVKPDCGPWDPNCNPSPDFEL